MQQIHGSDDHGDVGCVFAGNVVKLLFGADGEALELRLPVFQRVLAPVAVGFFHDDAAVGRHLVQHGLQLGQLRVVRVDEHGDFLEIFHRYYSQTAPWAVIFSPL